MAYGFYSDIVRALRSEVTAEDHRGAGGLCGDAADEIERLRSALQSLLSATNPLTEAPDDLPARRSAAAKLLPGLLEGDGAGNALPPMHLSDKPEVIDGCECAICKMHRCPPHREVKKSEGEEKHWVECEKCGVVLRKLPIV